MKKTHIVKKRQVQHTVNERWVAQALDHPFLLRLLSTHLRLFEASELAASEGTL